MDFQPSSFVGAKQGYEFRTAEQVWTVLLLYRLLAGTPHHIRLIASAPTLSAGDGLLQTICPGISGGTESESCQS